MTTIGGAPQGTSETGAVYVLCQLFKSNPSLRHGDIVIHANGRIDVAVPGESGVLRDWCRAIPNHRMRTALVPAVWGADEADVIEGDHITVTVRRPHGGVR